MAAEVKSSSVLEEINPNDASNHPNPDKSDGTGERKSFKEVTVAYVCNENYLKMCDRFIKVPYRASLIHSLIAAYGLLENMRLISPKPACRDDITKFHSTDFTECLKKMSDSDDNEKHLEEADTYGLTYDCPVYPGAYDYAAFVAGASLTAAASLNRGLASVAINWNGGWHHAKRDEASGFCYINDIVLAILKLREKFDRVLYVDLDLHHGDGVEDAFCATPKVMTVSFHKCSPGFFPGTGELKDKGLGKGKFYTVNVPLLDGIQDEPYCQVFECIMDLVRSRFEPDAVVCQCGADGLVEDPMDSFNLTSLSLTRCVRYLLDWGKPTLLVGGGGYNLTNTARCWAAITGCALNKTLPPEIPEHRFFTKYGPGYELILEPGNRVDRNTKEYLSKITEGVKENLSKLPIENRRSYQENVDKDKSGDKSTAINPSMLFGSVVS